MIISWRLEFWLIFNAEMYTDDSSCFLLVELFLSEMEGIKLIN